MADGLDRFVPDPAEQAYVGVRVGRLLGVASGNSGDVLSREELFGGWRLFFERLAAVRPVVLLVEDAQYADAGLLDFLEHLIDWTRDLPVFVLVFGRPELSQARPELGAGRNRSTLTLDPLDAASMDQLVEALVPGMPAAARAKITGQAQGIPLFAVETVRSLIDQDIVQPAEGAYRLTGDIGELAVPHSLHALLAARLDALDPGVRRLVADAAVLGSTFPAAALAAVSGQDEPSVRAGLADLVRRQVLSVSADPLSPERGSYRFAQDMLRQVAYGTLSRRDRKARHLKVATHLRAAFPGDGEEVADFIAAHYLDALNVLPADPDTAQIRGQAISALIRAAERAERTGAPARAAASYATAAGLTSLDSQDLPDGQLAAGALWERAAQAALTDGNYAAAAEHADRARDYYLQQGQARAAARARAIAGRALYRRGRLAEARGQLAAAMEVLRAEPDLDTVYALGQLAAVEVFAGSPDADRLSAEALTLSQALGASTGQSCDLLILRGTYHSHSGRRLQAVAYYREGVRLSTQDGDNSRLGSALVNLAAALSVTDPAAAADAARTAAGHLRRVGSRDRLPFAIMGLAIALIMLGDWDAAEAELTREIDSAGLADVERLACMRSWLAALRGDAATAETVLAELRDLRASEESQDQAALGLIQAFTAAARRQPQDALRHARATLAQADTLGMSYDFLCWAWPLAARAAWETGETTATSELLALLDATQPGHLAGMLRAERDLARARLAAQGNDQSAAASFASAVSSLRELSTPYHLAHGLLDHAYHLTRLGDADAAALAIDEARVIGRRLRCQPLLDRVADMKPSIYGIQT
ncbi:MAG TPA: hypothetical protein VIY52_02775 [Streptosporangiaceae bacterium]